MIKPISPLEVKKKRSEIPDEVIELFNEAISDSFNGHYSVVKQNGLVSKIAKRLSISRQEAFDKGYLDVEDIFRKAGWLVEYDKPGYNEDYEAFFKFTPKKKQVVNDEEGIDP